MKNTIAISILSLIATAAQAISTAPPTNYVPEPETWMLLGAAGIAAIIAKKISKK